MSTVNARKFLGARVAVPVSLRAWFNWRSSTDQNSIGTAAAGTSSSSGNAPCMTLRRAVQIAAIAHQGQDDQTGQPRILHALRVMNACSSEEERIVAMLHAVVESGQCTLEELRREGLPDTLVEAVDALTRRPGETHAQSADRTAGHPIAQAVKIAELRDNLQAVQVGRDARAR